MSKRCCAKQCYNSQITNRHVSYFGFPKNLEIAAKWATAAGREDLLTKNINIIIKYFICSEHFTKESFADPPHNTRLKKSNRSMVSYPIPTIFQDNFQKFVSLPSNQPNEETEDNNIDAAISLETEYSHKLSDATCDLAGFDLITLPHNDPLNEIDVYNPLEDSIGFNDVTNADVNEFASMLDTEPVTTENTETVGVCRMCALIFFDKSLTPLAAIHELMDKIQILLPDMIQSDDNLPQFICAACIEKINDCYNIIDQMRKIQIALRQNYGSSEPNQM